MTHIYVPNAKVTDYTSAENWSDYSAKISAIVLGSGYCGDPNVNDGKDVTWTLTDDGTLTVSGTGAMANYASGDAPWYSNPSNPSSITNVVIEDGVESIGDYAFYQCPNLQTVSIPNGVTTIGTQAFYGCTSLQSVTIPNSVTSIGRNAFYQCTSLTTVTIGSGMQRIDNYAFQSCTSLTTVTVYAPSCALGTNVFNGTSLANIYVFSDKVTYYKGAPTNWINYKSKISAIPNVTANEGESGEYWATYYNELANVQMPSGTQVFKVALTGSTLEMTEITDRIVNAGEGVVLKSSSASITIASAASASATTYDGNSLEGTMTSITNPGNVFVLNKGTNGVGFYKLAAGGTIGANKAYLTYSGSLVREFFAFEEEDADGIVSPLGETEEGAAIYNLSGQRITPHRGGDGGGLQKGIYIVNGKKVLK